MMENNFQIAILNSNERVINLVRARLLMDINSAPELGTTITSINTARAIAFS